MEEIENENDLTWLYEMNGFERAYHEFDYDDLIKWVENEIELNANDSFKKLIKGLIKEITLMEESAKEHEWSFKEQQMISASMCSAAMATAYRLVINKLKEKIR